MIRVRKVEQVLKVLKVLPVPREPMVQRVRRVTKVLKVRQGRMALPQRLLSALQALFLLEVLLRLRIQALLLPQCSTLGFLRVLKVLRVPLVQQTLELSQRKVIFSREQRVR